MVNPSNKQIMRILVIHLIPMKNLFALLSCLGMTCSLLSQAPNMNYDPDWDGDGSLGVSDLLGFLALFGDFDTDGDGIWDSVDQCVDMEACNFDSNPSVPCTYLDAIGICGGWCESDENEDGICDFTCGVDSIAYHGYSYATVQIGEQCWLAQNLRNEYYTNGDVIPGGLDDNEWSTTAAGAFTVYGEGTSIVYGGSTDTAENIENYGCLYNWYAVDDERNLCPSSWHVPTDEEYMTLEMELGMSESVINTLGWRGTDQGAQVKSSPEDEPSWNGTNTSGFSGLPGGDRWVNGTFYFGSGYLWTSSSFGAYAWLRGLQHAGILREFFGKSAGLSIRCIKD